MVQTKELLADLQDLLPNTEDAGGANLTMNTVLQCAIDFLTQHAGEYFLEWGQSGRAIWAFW